MSNLFPTCVNDYPYRNIEDTNLDWIFKTYGQIKQDVADLNAYVASHKVEYDELVRRVNAIANEIDTFESRVNTEFASLKNDLEREFDALKNEVYSELSETKTEIENEFNTALVEFSNKFDELESNVKSDINNMQIEINRLLNYLVNEIAEINANVIDYVNDRLNDFIAHLPDYENLIVNNPVTGTQTNVQTAINDLYLYFAVFGLTAREYDSLQLSAASFDAKELTAHDYDLLSYKLLEYPDPQLYMRDPFTGLIALNRVVIMELAELHKNALTAAEYDALEMPAETFDVLNITAYYYDWYGISLFENAITAADYDGLDIDALDYDLKRIGAYDYDNYATFILSA